MTPPLRWAAAAAVPPAHTLACVVGPRAPAEADPVLPGSMMRQADDESAPGQQRGGVSAPSAVDVRDMLCAQALASVARAVKHVRVGGTLQILYNAEDVKRDLLTWAADQHHRMAEAGPAALQLIRGRETGP